MVFGLEDCAQAQSRRKLGPEYLNTGETKSLIKVEGLEMDHPRETGPRLGLAAPDIPQGPPRSLAMSADAHLCGLVVSRLCWSFTTPLSPHILELLLPSYNLCGTSLKPMDRHLLVTRISGKVFYLKS